MEKRDLNDDPPPPYPGTTPEAAPTYPANPGYYPKHGPQLYPGLEMDSGLHQRSGPQVGTQAQSGATQRNMIVQHVVGPEPAHIICPSCHAEITTRIEPKVTTRTHIMAGILCVLFGLFCVWLPYCVDGCKNADHHCPNCEAYIGTYTR